jgi:Flp pilus assembly protein TadG
MIRIRSNRRSAAKRRAVATVEMAVLLPAMIAIVFGTIEITSRVFLRQTGAVVAYEGVRLAARRTVDSETVLQRCEQILADRRVTNAVIEITPPVTSEVPTGGLIQVRITIPYAGNTPAAAVITGTQNLQVTATMVRE